MYLLTDQELADIYTNRKLYRLIERMIDEMLKMFGDKT